MNATLRREEYTAMGDFILPSFVRDQATIVALFPKFDAAFLTAFTTKLDFVKQLESSVVKTEQQKTVTISLYEDATALNNELTLLVNYAADAGISITPINALKKDLRNRNIEGAILNIEAVKQYVIQNQPELEAEGMTRDFITKLDDYSSKLTTKNALQNVFMNSLKQLTQINSKHYDELYGFMLKIANKGKLVFKDSIIKDEYSLRKNMSRMRAAKLKDDTKNAA